MIDFTLEQKQTIKKIESEGVLKFQHIMDILPFNEMTNILRKPNNVSILYFTFMASWMKPKYIAEEKTVEQVIIEYGLLEEWEISNKIKQKGIAYNGQKLTMNTKDTLMEYFMPGWAVISVGKKNHTLFMNTKLLED